MVLTASLPKTVRVSEVVWDQYEALRAAVQRAVRRRGRPELEDDVLNNVFARALRNPPDPGKGSTSHRRWTLVELAAIDVVGRRASSHREIRGSVIAPGSACVDGEARAIAHLEIREFSSRFTCLSRKEQEQVRRDVGAKRQPSRARRTLRPRGNRRALAVPPQNWLALLLVALMVLYVFLTKREP